MPIDASIPLQARGPQFMGPEALAQIKNALYQQQLNQMRVQEAQTQTQGGNALAQILQQYGGDPQKVPGNAFAQLPPNVARVAMEQKLAMEREAALAQRMRATADRTDAQATREANTYYMSLVNPVGQSAIAAYDAAMRRGVGQDVATREAQQVFNTGLNDLAEGGDIPPAVMDRMRRNGQFNRDAFNRMFNPKDKPGIVAQLEEVNRSDLTPEQRLAARGRITGVGATPAQQLATVDAWEQAGILTPEAARKARDKIGGTQNSPLSRTLATNEAVASGALPADQGEALNQQAAGLNRGRAAEFDQAVKKLESGEWTQAQFDQFAARGRNVAPGTAMDQQYMGWGDAEKDTFARESMRNSKLLIGLGRGAQGAQNLMDIRRRQIKMQLDNPDQPGLATQVAAFEADNKSYKTMTEMYDAVSSFEELAKRNGNALVDLAKKVDKTGVPVVERWVRAGRKAIAGDADVSEFQAQLQLFTAEAARLLTQPTLKGPLTDSARHEVQDILPQSASAGQIERVVNRLTMDFDNRKKSVEGQLENLRKRMQEGYAVGRKPGETVAPASPPTAPSQGGGAPSRAADMRVPPAVQGERDSTQARILRGEYMNEVAALSAATTAEKRQFHQDNINSLRKEMQGKGIAVPETAAPAPKPEASGQQDLQRAVTAQFGAYEPDKYEYRIGPNGRAQRKRKDGSK